MRELDFKFSITGRLKVARQEDTESALEVRWPGLMVDASIYPVDKWWTYGAYGDEYAVYAALAWRIALGRELFAIPSYYGERAATNLGRDGFQVHWDYEVDTGEEMSVDRGFERGRTVNLATRTGTIDEHALLFPIHTWAELAKVQMATRGDAAGQVTLFALRPGRGDDLTEFLNTRNEPDLESFLADDERLIVVCVGEDLGYNNCVIVKSPGDLEVDCGRAAAEINAQVADYENTVQDIKSIDEFIDRVTGFATG